VVRPAALAFAPKAAPKAVAPATVGRSFWPTVAGATAFGAAFGAKAKAAGLTTVVFDRAGRRYHGAVKAFADAARAAGLLF